MMIEKTKFNLARSICVKNYYDVEENETDDALWLPFGEPRRATYSYAGLY